MTILLKLRAKLLTPLLSWPCRAIGEHTVNRADWYKSYSRYLDSWRWQFRRRLVLFRDAHRCRKCGKRAVEVHHLTYDNVGHEQLKDLLSLCKECHKNEHN